jgi:hypothetical protein
MLALWSAGWSDLIIYNAISAELIGGAYGGVSENGGEIEPCVCRKVKDSKNRIRN